MRKVVGPIIQVTFRDMLPDEAAVKLAFAAQARLRMQHGAQRHGVAALVLSPASRHGQCALELKLSGDGSVRTVCVQGASPADAVERAFALLELPELRSDASGVHRLERPPAALAEAPETGVLLTA